MKKIKKKILFQISLFLTLFSCVEETEFEHPLVFTGGVTEISKTKATFSGKISNQGEEPIRESGFIWGLHKNNNNGLKLLNPTTPANYFSLQSDVEFLPNKTFYVRAFVQTEKYTTYGREVSFKTDSSATNLGAWTRILNEQQHWSERIQTSFTINELTYWIVDDGTLYSYNNKTSEIKLLLEQREPFAYFRNSFIYAGFVYLFALNSFYKFNPNDLSFTKLTSWRDRDLMGTKGFMIGENIYIGLGSYFEYSRNFWKYNIPTDSWMQVSDFPGEFKNNAFSFTISETGYLGGGYSLIKWPYKKMEDLWSYDHEKDEWLQRQTLPIDNTDLSLLEGTSTENFGYAFYKNELFEYNPIFDVWEKMTSIPNSEIFSHPHLYTVNNKIFLVEATRYDKTKYFKLWSYEK